MLKLLWSEASRRDVLLLHVSQIDLILELCIGEQTPVVNSATY